MSANFYHIVFNTHYAYVILVNILLLFFIKKYGNSNRVMKIFLLYPIFALTLLLINSLFQYRLIVSPYRQQILISLNSISDVIHFLILGLIIIKITLSRISKKIILFFYIGACAAYFLLISFNDLSIEELYLFKSIFNFFLFSFCIVYFIQLLISKSFDNIDIRLTPEFWIVSGIFISMGLLIPQPIIYIVFKKNYSNEAVRIILLIQCFCMITLYSFFLKGALCLKKMNKN